MLAQPQVPNYEIYRPECQFYPIPSYLVFIFGPQNYFAQ